MTERVSPRVFRVVALPGPSDPEKTQMFKQRYIKHFPAAGEIVIFDRSWYNRAASNTSWGSAANTTIDVSYTKHAPWYIVHSDDKRRARRNCISHILRLIPYKKNIGATKSSCRSDPTRAAMTINRL
jgi:polyphosphate kinase 2 (PPK2 family)